MSVRAKYKTKVKNIIKLEAFYNKINKQINNKDGKRNISS
jgi:hypothetical protein